MSLTRRQMALLPLAAGAVRADLANGDPRLEKLYGSFIAPCCWRANLRTHQSPKADELRADIQRLIAEGRSDDEIKAQFIDRYTRRILALPEGATGDLLSWMPWAAATAGLGAIGVFLHRSTAQQPAPAPPGELPELPELPD